MPGVALLLQLGGVAACRGGSERRGVAWGGVGRGQAGGRQCARTLATAAEGSAAAALAAHTSRGGGQHRCSSSNRAVPKQHSRASATGPRTVGHNVLGHPIPVEVHVQAWG